MIHQGVFVTWYYCMRCAFISRGVGKCGVPNSTQATGHSNTASTTAGFSASTRLALTLLLLSPIDMV